MNTTHGTHCFCLASASVAAVCFVFAPSATAQQVERTGGRAGLSLLVGLGRPGGDTSAATLPLTGLALRFGGAFTDRFHLLGEFTLAVLPGGALPNGRDVTAFHAALDLKGEGYIGPRFFLRGGFGAGWASATYGNTWILPLPGPRIAGAVGYNLWRRGEQTFSLTLETSYSFLYRYEADFNRIFTFGLGVAFDWY